jgi:hypothetical protein
MTINHTSKAAGTFSKIGELNAKTGKKLDPQEEYIFELIEAKDQQMKAWQSAEDKTKGIIAPKKTFAATTWRELTTGIEVFQKFNIENISWGTGPNDSKRHKAVKFFLDVGIYREEDKDRVITRAISDPSFWDSVFIPTMKIRARVVPATAPDEYFFKEGSFRKYQV